MMLSCNWLREYLSLNIATEEISKTLNNLGFEVEDSIFYKEKFKGVVIGKVLSVEKHPNADKLNLCKVLIPVLEQKNEESSTKTLDSVGITDTQSTIHKQKKDNSLTETLFSNMPLKIAQIVCGASNVRPNIFVPIALPETKLPNGVDIGLSTIRGILSEGMICAADELCIHDSLHSNGIMILGYCENDSFDVNSKNTIQDDKDNNFIDSTNSEYIQTLKIDENIKQNENVINDHFHNTEQSSNKSAMILQQCDTKVTTFDHNIHVGQSFSSFYYGDDEILDVSITPNRGDCNGLLGFVREIAAYYNIHHKSTEEILNAVENNNTKINTSVRYNNESQESYDEVKNDSSFAFSTKIPVNFACSVIENIYHVNSPDWVNSKLRAIKNICNNDTINNLGRYIVANTGIPLHIYDKNKIKGEVTLRHASTGEIFHFTLEEKIALSEKNIVIVDSEKVLSILNVADSYLCQTSDETTSIFTLCAYITPDSFINANRTIQIESTSKYIATRGFDSSKTLQNISLLQLLLSKIYKDGKLKLTFCTSENQIHMPSNIIHYSSDNLLRLTGLSLSLQDVVNCLQKLDFTILDTIQQEENNTTNSKYFELKIQVPRHRHDISQKEDITEEILRFYGVDNIKSSNLELKPNVKKSQVKNSVELRIIKTFAERGFKEVVNFLFIEKEIIELFCETNNALELSKPLGNLNVVQGNAVANLVKNVSYAITYNESKSINFVEWTKTFSSPTSFTEVIAGVRAGSKFITGKSEEFEIQDIKEDLYLVLKRIFCIPLHIIETSTVRISPIYGHPHKSFSINIQGTEIAKFGEIHPSLLKKLSIEKRILWFEIFTQNAKNAKWQDFNSQISKIYEDKNVYKTEKKIGMEVDSFSGKKVRDICFVLHKDIVIGDVAKSIKESSPFVKDVSSVDVFTDITEFGEKFQSVMFSFAIKSDESLTNQDVLGIFHSIVANVEQKHSAKLRGELTALN